MFLTRNPTGSQLERRMIPSSWWWWHSTCVIPNKSYWNGENLRMWPVMISWPWFDDRSDGTVGIVQWPNTESHWWHCAHGSGLRWKGIENEGPGGPRDFGRPSSSLDSCWSALTSSRIFQLGPSGTSFSLKMRGVKSKNHPSLAWFFKVFFWTGKFHMFMGVSPWFPVLSLQKPSARSPFYSGHEGGPASTKYLEGTWSSWPVRWFSLVEKNETENVNGENIW
jgi:hypothetical protein